MILGRVGMGLTMLVAITMLVLPCRDIVFTVMDSIAAKVAVSVSRLRPIHSGVLYTFSASCSFRRRVLLFFFFSVHVCRYLQSDVFAVVTQEAVSERWDSLSFSFFIPLSFVWVGDGKS